MTSFRIALMTLTSVLALTACDGKDKEAAGGQPGGEQASGEQGEQQGGGAPQAMPVTVAHPLVSAVDEYREFAGRFEATDTVDVRARVSGYLTQVLFKDGTIVKKGDPLFVVDPRPYEATLRQREADRKVAASQVAAAENNLQRAQSLYQTGDVSAALLDQRRAAADSAKASVAAAQAAVDAAKLDLQYTRITAPITGRISNNRVTVGNLINPGDDVLTTIVSLSPIYFYFDVDEKTYVDYARSTTGAGTHDSTEIPVNIALSDEEDYSHPGALDFIDNAIAASTGTMRGRAVVQNPDMFLTPGMFGRARIRTGGSPTGVLVPDEAIITDQNRKLVYVVGANNIVEPRPVELAQMDKGLRVVTKGLDGSEWVVVNGVQRAMPGAPVAPQQSEIKPASNAQSTVSQQPTAQSPEDNVPDEAPTEQLAPVGANGAPGAAPGGAPTGANPTQGGAPAGASTSASGNSGANAGSAQ